MRHWMLSLGAAALVVLVVVFATRQPDPARGGAGGDTLPLVVDEPAAPTMLDLERALAEAAAAGYSSGAADAPVQVIEFSDFGCPYCAKFARESYPVLEREFVSKGRVRWTYVPFVMGMFPNGDAAALASECAAEQGQERFRAMHDLLYERQQEWKTSGAPQPLFEGYAARLGLAAAEFAACYREARPAERIARSNAIAERLGVRATPSFFINGRLLEGALPVEDFRMVLGRSAE